MPKDHHVETKFVQSETDGRPEAVYRVVENATGEVVRESMFGYDSRDSATSAGEVVADQIELVSEDWQ